MHQDIEWLLFMARCSYTIKKPNGMHLDEGWLFFMMKVHYIINPNWMLQDIECLPFLFMARCAYTI